jgi:hypothetical protein
MKEVLKPRNFFISNDLVTQQNSLYSAINQGKLLVTPAQDFNANGEFT